MSYILCFWDKSKIQVSDEIGEKIKMAKKSDIIKNFELGKNMYELGGIEKIITKEEAYNVFPTESEYLSRLEDRQPNEESLKVLGGQKVKELTK